MESGGASHDNMNIEANETEIIETSRATYGLFFIDDFQYRLTIEVIFGFLIF